MPDYGIINDRSPHIIADLCELVCYLENSSVSRGDIEGFIQRGGGTGLLQDLEAEDEAEANEKLQVLTEDAFQQLVYRQETFGDWYPFVAQHDVLELKDGQTERQKIYATLLVDSRLKMFTPATRTRLAAEFETLCLHAMSGLFPAWNVYHFGTGGRDRAEFGNKLKDALRSLGRKMRDCVLDKHVNELSDQNTGDGGIDLVAIHEWGDAAGSVAAYFAQCAAQQEGWPEKRFESHPVTHERFFSFFHKPGSILFIPIFYRESHGDWIDSVGHGSLLIDRLRIIELYELQIRAGTKAIADIFSVITDPFAPGAFLPEEAA